MPKSITPFLMFEGAAERAMAFYVSLFPDAVIKSVDKYGPGEHGAEGTVRRAVFVLAGREYVCIDSPVPHGFTFTPSFSLFVQCEDEAEFESVYARLAEGGKVMMPPGNYGFSDRFAWLGDRFGVSWQLNVGGDWTSLLARPAAD